MGEREDLGKALEALSKALGIVVRQSEQLLAVQEVLRKAESGADAWGACSHEWLRIADLRDALAAQPAPSGAAEGGTR